LEKAIEFYRDIFGLRLVERVADHYAFLTGNEMHHTLALQNVGEFAARPKARSTGLYHLAFEVPDRPAFAAALRALEKYEITPSLVDHGISWAMYFNDLDGNGLEIYWDTRHLHHGRQLWAGNNRPLSAGEVFSLSNPSPAIPGSVSHAVLPN
jgi:catechol 2,3-dioxygenase